MSAAGTAGPGLRFEFDCLHCDWNGPYESVIQAGLDYELCPKCEQQLHRVELKPQRGEDDPTHG